MEERQQKLEERQQKLEEKFAQLEERFAKLEDEVREFRRLVTVIAHRFGVISESGFREVLRYVVQEVFKVAEVRRWVYRDESGYVYGYPAVVEGVIGGSCSLSFFSPLYVIMYALAICLSSPFSLIICLWVTLLLVPFGLTNITVNPSFNALMTPCLSSCFLENLAILRLILGLCVNFLAFILVKSSNTT